VILRFASDAKPKRSPLAALRPRPLSLSAPNV
jgi:hypothetical protein